MPRRLLVPVLLLVALVLVSGRLRAIGPNEATAEPFFTPSLEADSMNGKRALLMELNKAQRRILVQVYRFTDRTIANALIDARSRGVEVAVLLDPEMETDAFSQALYLKSAGIPVHTDPDHSYAHNSVFIIDEDEVITGSYNPTPGAALYNAENLLVVHSPMVASAFTTNFLAHAGHSRRYEQEEVAVP